MMGKGVGVGGRIAKSSGAFFFVWTLIALGVTALFSVILSVRGLWGLQWAPAQVVQQPEHGEARRTGVGDRRGSGSAGEGITFVTAVAEELEGQTLYSTGSRA
jgi:hypothetical protein